MRSKLLIGGLLASVMILPAFAQGTPPSAKPSTSPPAATPAPADKSTAATPAPSKTATGEWRASKLIGLDVYNDQNEKLGDISEILLDKSGKVEGVVIGVGGFLGVGQHEIKVEMSKLKFSDQPVKTSSSSGGGASPGGGVSTTGAGGMGRSGASSSSSSSSSDHKWYPDHAVLSGATKDQLKAMPQFKY